MANKQVLAKRARCCPVYLLVSLYLVVSFFLCHGEANADGKLSVSVNNDQETISITVSDLASHKVFLLEHPDRLVVDVPVIHGSRDMALPASYSGKLIKTIRTGRFNPSTSRIVFDLKQPVQIVAVHDDEAGKGRLSIDLAPLNHAESADTNPGFPLASLFSGAKPVAPRTEAAPVEHEEAKPKKKEKKNNKPLMDKIPSKPVIVIDAGHGGVDPGTHGPSGTNEKDVVLSYARALRAVLAKEGRYKVVLTRDSDEFIMLRKRVEIARKAGGSMFISLHADAVPPSAENIAQVRGLSIYTVSEKASDAETEALAARENKADVLSGMDLTDESKDVAGILISLAERETKNRSATLADLLVTSLDDKVHLLANSHRFAGFAVLKAPDIPSVLIEIGFLSNPQEEKLLLSKAYHDKVATGIAAGIDDYFRVEKRMGDQ